MLIREDYLSKIREFYDLDIIKVLIGIRRCGKSVLLKQIIDEIKSNVDDNHIIYINFEDVTFSYIKNSCFASVKDGFCRLCADGAARFPNCQKF